MTAAVAALALLLAWDASGLDLVVAGWFGSLRGFPLQDSWWARGLLHDGGRLLAWALLAALLLQLWRAPKPSAGAGRGNPTRRQRATWLGVVLLCAVAVPLLKRFSSTSCPYDLAVFGGVARHVSHWQLGVADGGGGHCFPSGHAVAAFAFFGMVFLWQPHDVARARLWLAGVLVAGAGFGLAQLVRGAHYPSHTLWSAWLCWVVCLAARAVLTHRSTIATAAAGTADDRNQHEPRGLDPARAPTPATTPATAARPMET